MINKGSWGEGAVKELKKRKYRPVNEVTSVEHSRMVREIFATITDRYDFLNHLLSLRQDVSWRRSAVRRMCFPRSKRLLDVATGTGDLAIEAIRHHGDIQVTGVDIVPEMLRIGQCKIEKSHLSDGIRFLQGDALHLPFCDDCFDVAVMAFGIRNIPNRPQVLREMERVVMPGGQVIILEMNFPRNRLFRRFYDLYLNRILPLMAGAFSGNPAAYHYLADSIMHFPPPGEFSAMMGEAGLTAVARHPLTIGITYLYIGMKPDGNGPRE